MFRIRFFLAALTAVSGSAMAATDFQGFYGQAGIGFENITSNNNETPTSANSDKKAVNTSGANSFAGVFTLGYMAPVTSRFLLGAGIDYSPIKSGTGKIVDGNYAIQAGTYQRNQYWSINLTPATPIGDDGLLYGKVGYTQASIKYQLGKTSNSSNVNGYALGVGYKHMVSKSVYGYIEANYETYGKDSSYARSANFSQSNVVFGVGYKF